jgi:hypothetical protein
MRQPEKRTGLSAGWGAIAGGVLSFCLFVLTVLSCMELKKASGVRRGISDDDFYYTVIGFWVSVIVGPMIGMVIGIVMARRRNKRAEEDFRNDQA